MNFQPKRTKKADWMSDLLAKNGYYVSGHPSFANQLNLPVSVEVVIRHFRLYSSPFPEIILLTLECYSGTSIPNLSTVKATPAFIAIKKLFPGIRIFTFALGATVFEVDGLGSLNSIQLRHWFETVDVRFVNNLGGVKPVNASSNDAFADWTRGNLTRQCVINDIDALLCPKDGNHGVLVELKRPQQDIHYWSPYHNDRGNYESAAGIANSTGLENRTIAYNVSNQTVVGLHNDVKWNSADSSLHSRFGVMPPKNAIASPFDNRISLIDRRSTN